MLRVSRVNGWCIVLIAGPATLATLLLGDWFSSLIGALVTTAGALELHGNRLLKETDTSGLRWMKKAQLFMGTVLWTYCIFQLATFNEAELLSQLPAESLSLLNAAGIPQSTLLPMIRLIGIVTYGAVMLASLIHQGGLFRYYHRSVSAVARSLEGPQYQ